MKTKYEAGKRYVHALRPEGVTLETPHPKDPERSWLGYDHAIEKGGCFIDEGLLKGPWVPTDPTEKVDLTLAPPAALAEMCRVFAHGLTKYPARNDWRGKVPVEELAAKALRHVVLAAAGVGPDDESGLSHWAHAMAECAMVLDVLAWEEQGRPEVVDPGFYGRGV